MSTPFAEVTVRTHRQRFQLPVVTSLQHGIVVLLSKRTQHSNTATNNNNQYNSQPTTMNASTFDLPSPIDPFLRTLFPKNAHRSKQRQNTTDNDTTRHDNKRRQQEQNKQPKTFCGGDGRTDAATQRRSDTATQRRRETTNSEQASKRTKLQRRHFHRRSPFASGHGFWITQAIHTIVRGRFNHSTIHRPLIAH